MPRPLRMEFEGAVYHVMSRGDRREPIFRDDEDRKGFLQTLGEGCAKTDWQIHALCLMSNHFHLVVETRRELERQMELRRGQEGKEEEWGALRRGWFFGDEALKEELLAQASERVGAHHYGADRQESGVAKAERLVREELKRFQP